MYCSNCGKELKDDAVFCDKCGTKVGESAPTKNITLWQDIKTFLAKHKKTICGICLIVCLFIATGSLINLIQTGGTTSSWRGPDAGITKTTGPRDVMLIIVGGIGAFVSIHILKRK